MSTMSCHQFQDGAESWLEGERNAQSEEHLRSCAACRGLIEDLGAIHAAASPLAEFDGDAPERVWLALRSQLEKEGLIREAAKSPRRGLGAWIEEIFEAVPRPALAGAYVAALLALSLTLMGPFQKHFQNAPATAVASVTPLSAQLDSDEQAALSSLSNADPAVTASLQSNLAILDKDISMCEKSLQENPDDEASRDYLYGAYQEKADLLAEISERGAFGQ